jgi:chemotaxis protein MotB
MAGKGGGAWKVAYADFVTAMMALFMVLWILGQNAKVKEAIAEHFSGDAFDTIDDTDGGNRHKKKESKNDRNLGEGGKRRPTVGMRPSERTSIGVTLYFPPKAAALDDAAREAIAGFVPEILGKPQLVELRGQASLAEVGGPEHASEAYQLAYKRCVAAMEELVKKGVSSRQLRISQTSPYDRPARTETSPHGDPAARVQVTVLSEWAETTDTQKKAAPAADAKHPAKAKHDEGHH